MAGRIRFEGREPFIKFHPNASPAHVELVNSERNDCVVRTMATCFRIPYVTAHAIAASLGRKPGHGMGADVWVTRWMQCEVRNGNALPAHSYVDANVAITPMTGQVLIREGMTLGKFMRTNPKGTFFVWVRSHVMCVRDGVVLDTGTPAWKQKIRGLWRIVE
jgi:hypothetical protein